MIIPYIGITDFMRFEEVERMLKVWKTYAGRGPERKLHVGVMTSRKTLLGLPTTFSSAFPKKEDIAAIFASDETFNCLHYAGYKSDPDLSKNLCEAIMCGGMGIHAVQLDMTWPDPSHVAEAVHRSRKNLEVILQIGAKAMEQVDEDPDELVERLEDYNGVIHRVLLDLSMGRGREMDAEGLLPFARAIRKRFPKLGLVAAGGLGPDTTHLVEPLVEEFPDISIDAEGKLRPSGNVLDPIDWNMARDYLIKAIKLFS